MTTTWSQRNLKGDPVIWAVVILLSVISLLVVYSSVGSLAYKHNHYNTEAYLVKHFFLLAAGLGAMLLFHKLEYMRFLPKMSRILLLVSVPLLLVTYLKGGDVNGASRWLTIPLINQAFQPSDLAKLALITYLASILSKNQAHIEDFQKSFLPVILWSGSICFLIALANVSTAAMLMLTCLVLMFIGRVPVRYLLYLVGAVLIVGALAFAVGQRGATALHRVEDFLDPSKTPDQTMAGYIAIANGGFFGQGPGNSHQKDFLPHAYSDFIYAIIVEEYGLLGACIVMGLYLTLLYRGMVTVSNSENAFGGLLSAGLSFALAIQAMLNMAVATGLVPVTGQTLPMLSMGGTSLLFTGASLGLILSVSRGSDSKAKSSSTSRTNSARHAPAL